MNLDLAVIGNSILSALIDKRGRVVWSCFPRPDGDPVFCALLDPVEPGAGVFEVEALDCVADKQEYLGSTAILVTTLTDRNGGQVRITDFIPRYRHYDRIFRAGILVRKIEPLAGTPHVRIRVRPRFDNGMTVPTMTHGSNHIRYIGTDMVLRLTTDAPLTYVLEEHAFLLDSTVTLMLGPDEPVAGSLAGIANEFLERTNEYWLEWVRYLSVPFEWQDAVIRAAITLKLCSYEETGAILAALTTSIPEAPDTARNWDYRFCWLRDAYFVVQALNRLGATRTMEDFIRYITNVAALDFGGNIRPVYGLVPADNLEERVAPALKGYRGMGPVRIGNMASEQVQNDSYGSIVLASAQMFFDHRLPHPGDRPLFDRLEKLGEHAAKVALEPDAGLWEFRTRQSIHTHSVVMCWAACDRLSKIATILRLDERAAYWQQHAQRLHKVVLEKAWNPKRNSFVSTFDGEDLDASLLLLHEVGFIHPEDPRFVGTVDAVTQDLRRGDHILRYAVPDDFGMPHTSFTVCTFWYITALAAIGRREEARTLFEGVLACRNHLGLLSEDIATATGELWGNFPQTYSMVGLVITAMRLSKTWEEAFWRGS
jgi:GH15 family glucan-1,4-alpha-glucosidase